MTNRDMVIYLYDLFNHRQWEQIASLYRDNARFTDSRYQDRVVTMKQSELPSRHAALERRYPGLREKILFIEENGDQVFVQCLTSGTSRTGQAWNEPAWMVFTIVEGQIAQVANYFSHPQ